MPEALKPPPSREEKPRKPARPAEPGSNKGVLIGFGVAALIAAVIGFMIAGSGGSSGGGGAPTQASANSHLEAQFPEGWGELGSPPEIPGMTLADPVAVAPKGSDGAPAVVFGQVKEGAGNSTLLPAGFLDSLGLDPGQVPKRAAVRLSREKLQAYRYENLRPKGLDQPVTVFASPTSEGVATIACIAPGADCEAIANTLKLNAGTPFPVGPSKEYAAALSKELGGLNSKVSSGRPALQKAKTGKAQGAAARKLAADYADAAKGLEGLKLSPADRAANAQLTGALKETGAAYRKLGAAAIKGDRGAYGRAGKAVSTGEQALAGALRGLQAAGYKIA